MSKLGTIGEAIADMKSGNMDFTVDGKCSGCGQCCSNYLPVGVHEVRNIHRYIEKHDVKEVKRFGPSMAMIDMVCPFRSDLEQKCLIYPVRPAICRDYQCDKPQKEIAANKELYHGKFAVVNMRREFFGGETGLEDMLQALIMGGLTT